MTSFEVCGHDGSVLFLPGSIPDVQFGRLIFEVDIFDFEVDCGDLGVFFCQEVSFGKPPEEGSFAYIAISDDDYFISFLIFVCREVAVLDHAFFGFINNNYN